MLVFAKDITQKDYHSTDEEGNPGFKEYMAYQRKLFPYTIIRAGLDLAYKELDDILNYVDNGNRPPEGSPRQDYPADVPHWYKNRFPWTASFLNMEDMHALLVMLIKAMDSFRTWETLNSFHWTVLYDCTHNIVNLYNNLLDESADRARDINLSNGVPVNFDDFINNYWPHLNFMIMSKPDYPHARLLEKNRQVEEEIQSRMRDGEDGLTALAQAAGMFQLDESDLALLRHDPVQPRLLELKAAPLKENPYEHLYRTESEGSRSGQGASIDAEYKMNYELAAKSFPVGS